MNNFSSLFTFPLKFLSPLLGIFILLLAVVDVVEYYEYMTSSDYLLLAAVIAGNFLIYKFFIPLKKVKRVDDKLVISNYRKKIEVPISEITGLGKSLKFIEIYFDNKNDFGYEILILPLKFGVVGSDPNLSLHYIASKLGLRVTADGDAAVKNSGEDSAAENDQSSPG